jgi:hypothetical protein
MLKVFVDAGVACEENCCSNYSSGPVILTSAGSSALRLTWTLLARGGRASERPGDGLLRAPGDTGWLLPTLEPGRLTGEQTSFGIGVLFVDWSALRGNDQTNCTLIAALKLLVVC